MRLHRQFDLNLNILKPLGRELFTVPPHIVEQLATKLSEKGYTVLKSSVYFMGIPQSITLAKDFTGPFVNKFSEKIRSDFLAVSKVLGIEKLFD